jgi:hypothetical protein
MRIWWESGNRIGFPGSWHCGFSRLFEPAFESGASVEAEADRGSVAVREETRGWYGSVR